MGLLMKMASTLTIKTAIPVFIGMVTFFLPLASASHADGQDTNAEKEQSTVIGGANPTEIDGLVATKGKFPGSSGSTGRSRSTPKTGTKNSTTAPGSKAPVPKPYALTELSLRNDPRGDEGPNLEGEPGTWCTATKTTTSATPFAQSRINKAANRNKVIRDLGYKTCVLLASEQAKLEANKLVLPTPVLEIDPGWAITGLKAYLETKGKTVFDGQVPIGNKTLNVHATGEYFVDWGDNTGQWGPYNFEGLPWPEGQITHVYQYTGDYTVRVRELWTARWTLGNQSGVLTDRFSEASIPLTVRELQAVRIR
ncbi:MAG: PKD domain-containing protein [Acidimicrobiales bacterium]